MLLGDGFWRLSRDALERSWVPGQHLERFWVLFVSEGGVRRGNSEKLEFADRLNEHAMFLRSQELQHETKLVPKLAERRKNNREEAKREQRETKVRSRTFEERFGTRSFDLLGPWGRHGGTRDAFSRT